MPIIIATNNGMKFMPALRESLGDLEHHIVDTGSTDEEYLEYLDTLPNVHHTSGYCIGAYKYAIDNILADWYFFMHDSMVVKDKNFLEKFKDKGDCVGWLCNPMFFDNNEQRYYVEKHYGSVSSDRLMFGPIFYATRRCLRDLVLPPVNSINEFRAMERGIACGFVNAGVNVQYLDQFDTNRMFSDGYPLLTKIRPQRDATAEERHGPQSQWVVK